MRSFSSSQATELASGGHAIYWLVRIMWPEPLGTRYYSERPFTPDTGIVPNPILLSVPKGGREIDQGFDGGVSIENELVVMWNGRTVEADETERLQTQLESLNTVKNVRLTLFVMFGQDDALAVDDWTTVQEYVIDDYEDDGERISFRVMSYPIRAFEKVSNPDTILLSDWPKTTREGEIIPSIIGDFDDYQPSLLTKPAETTLDEDLNQTETLIDVIDASEFPTPVFHIFSRGDTGVWEEMRVNSKTATQFNVDRAVGPEVAQFHSEGAAVVHKLLTPKYMVSDHPILSLGNVRFAGPTLTLGGSQFDETVIIQNGKAMTVLEIDILAIPEFDEPSQHGNLPYRGQTVTINVNGLVDPYVDPQVKAEDPEVLIKMLLGVATEEGTALGTHVSTTIQDTTQSWTTGVFVGQQVRLRPDENHEGTEEIRHITGNGSFTLFVTPAWTIDPIDGDEYVIQSPAVSMFMGLGVEFVDLASLSAAITDAKLDESDWIFARAINAPTTMKILFETLIRDSGIFAAFESGKFRFFPSLLADPWNSDGTFSRADMYERSESGAIELSSVAAASREVVPKQSRMRQKFGLRRFIRNQVRVNYFRAFAASLSANSTEALHPRFPKQKRADEEVSQLERWKLKDLDLDAEWIRDGDTAAALALRTVRNFAWERRNITLPFRSLSKLAFELGDTVLLDDPDARLFSACGIIVGSSFPSEHRQSFSVLRANRRIRIWENAASGSYIDVFVCEKMVFVVDGVHVATLKPDGSFRHLGPLNATIFTRTVQTATDSAKGEIEYASNSIYLALAENNEDVDSTALGTHGTSTLEDTSQSWTTNEWAGQAVGLRFANASTNEFRTIASNTATVLTIVGNWVSDPIDTDPYRIYKADGGDRIRAMRLLATGEIEVLAIGNRDPVPGSSIAADTYYEEQVPGLAFPVTAGSLVFGLGGVTPMLNVNPLFSTTNLNARLLAKRFHAGL